MTFHSETPQVTASRQHEILFGKILEGFDASRGWGDGEAWAYGASVQGYGWGSMHGEDGNGQGYSDGLIACIGSLCCRGALNAVWEGL